MNKSSALVLKESKKNHEKVGKKVLDKSLGAIILAAGKGKRMNSKKQNKVVLPLANKPMILREIEFLNELKISPIVVVVGFARRSVEEILKGAEVIYAIQKKRLGTAHALHTAIDVLPERIENVLVIQGDDSLLYQRKNMPLIKKLIEKHFATGAALTFLTVEMENPFGMGRIIRDGQGKVISIVEEKDATAKQREIKEINSGCYIFNTEFLRKYLKKIKKSKVTGEYYLVSLVEIAGKHDEKMETITAGQIPWRGVNTPEELIEAESLFNQQI